MTEAHPDWHALGERVLQRLVHAAALAPLLMACSDGVGGGKASVDRGPQLTLEEERRIGSVEDPEIGFSQIAGIAVDEDEIVYVLEGQDRHVRAYDERGQRVRTFGRSGDGPGEFRTPARLGLIGDTLWVTDQANGRVTLFLRSGELIETFAPAPVVLENMPSSVHTSLLAGHLREDGLLTSAPRVLQSLAASAGMMPSDTFFVPTVVMDRTGAVADTLSLQPFWTPGALAQISITGRNISVPEAPSAAALRMDTPDGGYAIERPVAASAGAATYQVTRLSGLTDTIFRREYAYQPIAYGREAIDSVIAPRARSFVASSPPGTDTVGLASTALDALRRAVVLSPFQPPVTFARVGQDTMLWLRREDRGGPTFEWTLIGPDGAPRGTVELPKNITVHWSRIPLLWASVPDSFGVPWLVRYRMVEEAP